MKIKITSDIKVVTLIEATPTSASRLFVFSDDDEIEFMLNQNEINMFKEALK